MANPTTPTTPTTLTGIIEKTPHLFIGDTNHFAPEIPIFFVRGLPELKKAGVSHVFLEAPRNFQEHVDAYMRDGNRTHLEKLKNGNIVYEYTKPIIIACRECGITPILMDRDLRKADPRGQAFLHSKYYNQSGVSEDETTFELRNGSPMPEEYREGARILLQERREDNREMVELIAAHRPKKSVILVGNWHLMHGKEKKGLWKEGDMDEMLAEKPEFAGKTAVLSARVISYGPPGILPFKEQVFTHQPSEGKVDYVTYLPKLYSQYIRALNVGIYHYENGIQFLSEESARRTAEELNKLLPKGNAYRFGYITPKQVNEERPGQPPKVRGHWVELQMPKDDTDLVLHAPAFMDALHQHREAARALVSSGVNEKESSLSMQRLDQMAKELSMITQSHWKAEGERPTNYRLVLRAKDEKEAMQIYNRLSEALNVKEQRLLNTNSNEVMISEQDLRLLPAGELTGHFRKHQEAARKAIPEWMHEAWHATQKLKHAVDPKKKNPPEPQAQRQSRSNRFPVLEADEPIGVPSASSTGLLHDFSNGRKH